MRPVKLIHTLEKGAIYEMEASLWQFMPSTTYYYTHIYNPSKLVGPYKSVDAAQKALELNIILEENKVVQVDFVLRRRVR